MANRVYYNLADLTGPISAVGKRVLRCIEQQMFLLTGQQGVDCYNSVVARRVFDPIARAVWDNAWLALRHQLTEEEYDV